MGKLVKIVVITVVVVIISAVGGSITDNGMGWYRTLELPDFTPPGSVIGLVWTLIYTMAGIATYMIWQYCAKDRAFKLIVSLLVINAVLNSLWTWLFFGIHQMGLAVVEMTVLNAVNLAIIILCWNRQRIASLLFIPYFAWVCFATFLAATIWRLNS